MAPKSLTDVQKENQRKYILEMGKKPVIQFGLKKVSVDDIVKAAGIAKGTFYLYFKSKEDFIIQFCMDLSEKYFLLAETLIITEDDKSLKDALRIFLNIIFENPEFIFFFKEYGQVHEIAGELTEIDLKISEKEQFGKLLQLANIDTNKVKPGIVHNYIHAIYAAQGANLILEEYRRETIELMIEGLLEYIFSGKK